MRILISGAGMAGLAAAITLGSTGHDVTIVERARRLRTAGSPIDIRGDAIDIARQMGVLDQIAERRVSMTDTAQFVDATGAVLAELPGDEVSDSGDDIEIPREDLAGILHDALPAPVSLVFDESISSIDNDAEGVDVRFTSGAAARFDLVVGADGLHSLTRRLALGPEADYLRHLGFYIALTNLPDHAGAERRSPLLNWPGHMIGITRYNDTALGVMTFRSEWIDYDYHDLAEQKRIVLAAFDGHDEWHVPAILDAVRHDPQLYFDSISQIHMDGWHHSRVVLVGDAAHCASGLSGRGTSLALTGAWFLSEALRTHAGDLAAAYREYEANQRPYVTLGQASAITGGDLVVPATPEAISARNRRLRGLVQR